MRQVESLTELHFATAKAISSSAIAEACGVAFSREKATLGSSTPHYSNPEIGLSNSVVGHRKS
jgi:hypothetical protein